MPNDLSPPARVTSPCITENKVQERRRAEASSLKRDNPFASVLNTAHQVKPRQKIAAGRDKTLASSNRGAGDKDLKKFSLGPRVSIIAPSDKPIDEKSLLDFARTLGMDESMIKLIMTKPDAESVGQQAGVTPNGLPSSSLPQSGQTSLTELPADYLSLGDPKGTPLLTLPTRGAQSVSTSSAHSEGALLALDSASGNASGLPEQTAGGSGNTQPIAIPPQSVQRPTNPNETLPLLKASIPGISTQNRTNTPPVVSTLLDPRPESQDTPLEDASPIPTRIGAPLQRSTAVLGATFSETTDTVKRLSVSNPEFLSSASENETANPHDGVDPFSVESVTKALNKQDKFNMAGSSIGKALSEMGPLALRMASGKNSSAGGTSLSDKEVHLTDTVVEELTELSSNKAEISRFSTPASPGQTTSNHPFSSTSEGVVVSNAIDLASAAPSSPESMQDAAFRRGEQYQLLTEKMTTALGQRISSEFAKGTWQLDLQLSPAHLGKIDVRLGKKNGGKIDAEFTTTESATRDLLIAGLPKLKEIMALSGLELNSMSVRRDSAEGQGHTPPHKRDDANSSTVHSAQDKNNASDAVARVNYIHSDGLDITV